MALKKPEIRNFINTFDLTDKIGLTYKEARSKKKWFQYYLLLKKENINVTEIISKSRIKPNL